MEKRSIEDGFTLPERRRVCRDTDIPVSTKEYKRLQARAKNDGAYKAYLDPDQITTMVAEECKRAIVTVERGKCPKAAKASALREHDVDTGYRYRIEQIGHKIVDRVIDHLKAECTVQKIISTGMPGDESGSGWVEDIQVPSMSWITEEGEVELSYLNEDYSSTSKDSRRNFSYELHAFVERRVNAQMRELLKVEFNGESIWDNWRVIVDLSKGKNDSSRSVDANVYFDEKTKE
ncbi:hypothetical protein HZC21_05145 [Candidatus Peregrinibacteria bacterium]|nr:hypothetical protein [Candidatus Peregrinibacteria bacterium]